MAKTIKTVEIKGKAGKLIVNDLAPDREMWHKKGYTRLDGSTLVTGAPSESQSSPGSFLQGSSEEGPEEDAPETEETTE